jgi:hypothetical protein
MVVKRTVQAPAIVKHFNEIEDGLARFVSGYEVAAVNEFLFEGAPERFHGGVVVAISWACFEKTDSKNESFS